MTRNELVDSLDLQLAHCHPGDACYSPEDLEFAMVTAYNRAIEDAIGQISEWKDVEELEQSLELLKIRE